MPERLQRRSGAVAERERGRALGRELDRLLLAGARGGREGEHGDQGDEPQAAEHDENLLNGDDFRPGYGRASSAAMCCRRARLRRGVRDDPGGHRDEVHDRGGDHEQVEELVEAEGAAATGPGAGRRRSSRRPSRGRPPTRKSTNGATPTSLQDLRDGDDARPADREVRAGDEQPRRVDPGERERDPEPGPGPDARQDDDLDRAREHEQRDRRRGGRDEEVDRRVVDAGAAAASSAGASASGGRARSPRTARTAPPP